MNTFHQTGRQRVGYVDPLALRCMFHCLLNFQMQNDGQRKLMPAYKCAPGSTVIMHEKSPSAELVVRCRNQTSVDT